MTKVIPNTVKIIDDYMVCEDCSSWLVNADATPLDYYYSEEEAEERLNEIQNGERLALSRVYGSFFSMGQIKDFLDSSNKTCDCCSATESGGRIHFQLMAA